MVIFRIRGGLGNQLFQYAAGRGVSSKLGTNLYLSWSPWDQDPWVYGLDYFNTKGNKAKDSMLFGLAGLFRRQNLFDRLYSYATLLRIAKIVFASYHAEKGLPFSQEVYSKNGHYIGGFWQTEKYFKDIQDEIRKEVTLKEPLSTYSQSIMDQIRVTNAVSLHVRRGDYVTREKAAKWHGVCSPEYYKAAVELILKKVPAPHFFLFSDDYEWTKENFKWLPVAYTCVNNPSDKNYEDLMLMSACKHHIIANSSFSWWGAWLNPRKDKIVIAPKQWFANAPKNDPRDIVPEEWVRL